MLKEWIRANRKRLEHDILNTSRRPFFSPVYYAQYRVTLPLLKKFSGGRLIDLGCGDMPFRQQLSSQLEAYDSLDFFPRSNQVTYVGDIQHMDMIPASTYDTAICLEVLEHIGDPFMAVREIQRILKAGGVLIVSVPHLSRLHDEPHDYYRYTRHGLRYLLEQNGFSIQVLEQRGGLFSFLGHQVSTVALGLVWRVPLLQQVAWFLNSWLIVRGADLLDRRLDRSGIFALGYTAVASKQLASPQSQPEG
jgi:SAM-dependent methyltransferase